MTHKPSHQRIGTRFAATLIANLVRGGLSFAGAIVTARALGAYGYGNLMFLLGSFIAVNQMLDMGSSPAFYTFISSRTRGLRFLAVYTGWLGFQFAAAMLALGVLFPGKLMRELWVGQSRGTVLLTFGVSFLINQGWGTVGQLGEAIRKTVAVQAASIAQAVAHFALVVTFAAAGWLSVRGVLWLLIAEHLVLCVACGPLWARQQFPAGERGAESYRAVVREFTAYCKPLAAYAWLSFLYTFFDRWMLQREGGSVQQGFFSVGQQFAGVSLIAVTSILKVFWKEIAEAKALGDRQHMQDLYRLVTRGLYFTGAWISCLLIPYSQEILRWTVGRGYEAAWIPLALMLVFPVHQSLGQTQGTFFYASSETRSYARIGLVSMAASIPLTYFLVAPRSAAVAGLGLGALGIALKLVLVQIVQVNVQAYVIARQQGWAYEYEYQAAVLLGLLSLGWAAKAGMRQLFLACGLESAPGVLAAASLVYALVSLGALYRAPGLAGLTAADVRRARSAALGWRRPQLVAAA